MIKLNKTTNIPGTLLSNDVAVEKTKIANIVASGNNPKYNDFDSRLYGANDVRAQLAQDQHNKCIFCECTLLDKGGGEVEHYRPKTAVRQDKTKGNTRRPAYYLLGYEWENLSASCPECNKTKSTFFPLINPQDRFNIAKEVPLIINPYVEDPAQYIEYRRYRVVSKTKVAPNKGTATIDYLQLNERNDLLELRKRRYTEFINEMCRRKISFDDLLSEKQKDAELDGRRPESIEFLAMFTNQRYKF